MNEAEPITPAATTEIEQRVVVSTTKGPVTLALYPAEAPNTVRNFLDKVASDYYRGLTFHRVEGWVVQGGDPQGTGTGGGKMETELNDLPFTTGAVGVARGPDIAVSNDSQFFVVKSDAHHLDGQYTNFGRVVEGMDTINALTIGDRIESIELD